MGCSQSKSSNDAVVVEQPKAQAAVAKSTPVVSKQDEKPISALPEANSTVSGEKGVPNNVDPSTAKDEKTSTPTVNGTNTEPAANGTKATGATEEEKSDVIQEEVKAVTASPDDDNLKSETDASSGNARVEDTETTVSPSTVAVETIISADEELEAASETSTDPVVENEVESTTEAEVSRPSACKNTEPENESEKSPSLSEPAPSGAISGPSSTIEEGSGGAESSKANVEQTQHATNSGVETAHEKQDEETTTTTIEQAKVSTVPKEERRDITASEASDDNPNTNKPSSKSGVASDTKLNDDAEPGPRNDTEASETATQEEVSTTNSTDNAWNVTISSPKLKASAPDDESQGGAISSADAASTNESHSTEAAPPSAETRSASGDEEQEIAGGSKDDSASNEERPTKAPTSTCKATTDALEQTTATCISSEPPGDVAAAGDKKTTVVNQLAGEVVEQSPAVNSATEKECKLESDHETPVQDWDKANQRGAEEEESTLKAAPEASALLEIPQEEEEAANAEQNSVASTMDVADQAEPSPVVERQEVADKPATSVVKEETEESESSTGKHGREKSELADEEASKNLEPEKSAVPTLPTTKQVEEVEHRSESSRHLEGSEISNLDLDMTESQKEEDRKLPSTSDEKNKVNVKAPESAEDKVEESKIRKNEEDQSAKGANAISTSTSTAAVYAAEAEAQENITSNATTQANDTQKVENSAGDLEYSESQDPSSVYDDEHTETPAEEEEEAADDEPISELKNVTAMTRVLIPEDQRDQDAPKPSRWGWPTGLGLTSGTNSTGISSDSVASEAPQKEKPQAPHDKDRSASEIDSSGTRWGLKTGLLSFRNSKEAAATGEGDREQPTSDPQLNPAETKADSAIETNGQPSTAKSATPAPATGISATAVPPAEKPKASEPPKKKELTDIEKARLYAASVLLESENVVGNKEEEAPRRGFGSWLSR